MECINIGISLSFCSTKESNNFNALILTFLSAKLTRDVGIIAELVSTEETRYLGLPLCWVNLFYAAVRTYVFNVLACKIIVGTDELPEEGVKSKYSISYSSRYTL